MDAPKGPRLTVWSAARGVAVSWFDSFDTYATGTVNLYQTYPKSVMISPFSGTLNQATVEISPDGRNGGKALIANMQSGAYGTYLTRGIVGPTSGREPYVRIGMAAYLTAGSSLNSEDGRGEVLFSLRVAAQHRESSYPPYYEIDGVIQSYVDGLTWQEAEPPDNAQEIGNINQLQYRKDALFVGVGADGFIRVSVGDRSDSLGNGSHPIISRSTKQLPFNQWCHLEFSLFMGTPDTNDGFVYGWLDGELVLQLIETNLAVEANYDNILYRERTTFESLLNGPRVDAGSHLFNADNRGYVEFRLHPYNAGETNLIDDLYVLHDPSTPANVPIGDLVGIDLPVNADGTFQNSTIGGTTPAATHWQSVATDDGDLTRVEFDEFDEDAYDHESLDVGLTVKALRVIARAKKSDGGAGAIRLTATNGDGGLVAERQDVNSTAEYITISDTFERDPLGNEWTPITVNDSEIGIKRAL